MHRYLSLPVPRRIGILCTLGFLLVLLAAPVAADSIARRGDDWVRITASPCTSPAILALIAKADPDPHAHLDYRAAMAHLQGKTYAACWRLEGLTIAMVYDDGDRGGIPIQQFRPAPEA